MREGPSELLLDNNPLLLNFDSRGNDDDDDGEDDDDDDRVALPGFTGTRPALREDFFC